MPMKTSGRELQSPKTENACGLLPSDCPSRYIWRVCSGIMGSTGQFCQFAGSRLIVVGRGVDLSEVLMISVGVSRGLNEVSISVEVTV